MKTLKRSLQSAILIATAIATVGCIKQESTADIQINLDTKHEIGGISEFDRSKYMSFHSSLFEGDWYNEYDKLDYLLNDLDVYFGRDNGILGMALRGAKEDPNRPGYIDPTHLDTVAHYFHKFGWNKSMAHLHKYDERSLLVIGGQERPFWPDHYDKLKEQNGWAFASPEAAGEYMGLFFTKLFRNVGDSISQGPARPLYMEIINEPLYGLVTVGEYDPIDVYRYHNQVAKGFRKTNSDVKIGGYTTAFPMFDEDNFQRWEDRMKLFMDTCGEHVDFISIHLYDFNQHHMSDDIDSTFHGPRNFKGSRMEATMDMIEAYSYVKWGFVKPMMLTEYGGRDHYLETLDWSPYRDWHFMKSFSPMMMQFMQRPDIILKAIPYVMTKTLWATDPETGQKGDWRLLRQKYEAEGEEGEEWVFTEQIKFFEQWAKVKGTRVETKSISPDILVDAYVDENKAYVILSNLNFKPETFSLDILGSKNNSLKSISVKQLHLVDSLPVLDTIEIDANKQHNYTIDTEATAIIEYIFENSIEINKAIEEKKYYAETYYQAIEANYDIDFEVKGINASDVNNACVRLAFGRAHELSKKPVVKINGVELDVPTNFSADEQELRNQFFGLLEIPVPANALKGENKVTVSFPDSGGFVSSVALRVTNNR